jgi:hypothetical protein
MMSAACSGNAGRRSQPTVVPVPSSAPVQSVDGHRGVYLGALGRPISYAVQDMSFGPPSGSAKPRIRWQDAYASCFKGQTRCVATGDATVALAVATGPSGYPWATGRYFDRSLVYVVTWDKAPCATEQVSAPTCRVVNVVDAGTGSNAFAIEISSTQPIVGR